MTLKKNVFRMAAAAFAILVSHTASASTVMCSALDASQDFASFTSCQVVGGGPAGQDRFSNVEPIVSALFGDEGISITESGSFSAGPGTGSEFSGTRLSDGFEISEPDLNRTSFEFLSLPLNTLFVSLKAGNGFELFRVPDGGVPFTLAHSLNPGDTSHISTFAGTLPPVSQVPIPASGVLLVVALGGLAAMRRRT